MPATWNPEAVDRLHANVVEVLATMEDEELCQLGLLMYDKDWVKRLKEPNFRAFIEGIVVLGLATYTLNRGTMPE